MAALTAEGASDSWLTQKVNVARISEEFLAPGLNIGTKKGLGHVYRTWHEPMLASMGMPKAILYYTCII